MRPEYEIFEKLPDGSSIWRVCGFKTITLAWNQLAAANDGERMWIAIPRSSDTSLSIRTTTPTNVEFNGLSGWKSVVT